MRDLDSPRVRFLAFQRALRTAKSGGVPIDGKHRLRPVASALCAIGGVLVIVTVPLHHATASTDAAVASQLPAHLSLADALRIFRERGFDLLLADAAVASAEGELQIARALP